MDLKQTAGALFRREVERDVYDTDRRQGGGINRWRGGIAAQRRLNQRYRRPGVMQGRAGFNNRQRRGFSNGFGL